MFEWDLNSACENRWCLRDVAGHDIWHWGARFETFTERNSWSYDGCAWEVSGPEGGFTFVLFQGWGGGVKYGGNRFSSDLKVCHPRCVRSLTQSCSVYTGCPRRKGRNFGRVFLRSNYNDITQNTYIQSSMVTEILAREVWNFDSYYSFIDYQIHIETGRNMWFL